MKGRAIGGYFVRVDEHRFRATEATGGAWTPAEQHFSPMGGLLTHAIDRFVAARGGDELVTSRIVFDIFGTIPIEEIGVDVGVVRPGRTIELLEVVATADGRPAARARAWRLARFDTSGIVGGAPGPLPAPQSVAAAPLTDVWPGGYIHSIEFRPIGQEPGRGQAWVRTFLDLVAGEEASPLARFVALIDTANGVGVRVPPTTWFYPNVDLTIHLYRQPAGPWVGFDTSVIFGPEGHGVTSSDLYDETGAVGRAEQMLTIRRLGADR